MLNAGIHSFSVLTNHDEIDAGIARRQRRQIANRPEVREKLESLTKRNINALKAAADRRSDRPLQAYPGAFDTFDQLVRNVFSEPFMRLRSRLELLPLEFHAGARTRCFQNAHYGARDFMPDTVAGNKSDDVCLPSLGTIVSTLALSRPELPPASTASSTRT